LRPASSLGGLLARVSARAAPRRTRSTSDLGTLRLVTAAAGATAAAALMTVAPLGPIALLVGAGAGYLIPALVRERRAAEAREAADRRVTALVEGLDSLVVSGRPAETAMVALAARPTGEQQLDAALRECADAYALGAPLARALQASASELGLASLHG